jgi:hypothetical protein
MIWRSTWMLPRGRVADAKDALEYEAEICVFNDGSVLVVPPNEMNPLVEMKAVVFPTP